MLVKTPDRARELLAVLNRDPARFVEITKDQNDVLKAELDIGAMLKLPENISQIGNLLTALATPVPETASDFGENGVKMFKKLILMGATPAEATATAGTPEFEKVLTLHSNFENMVKQIGLANIPPEVMKEILKGENILLIPTENRPQYVKVVDCNGNTNGSNCTIPLPIGSEINGKSTGYDVDDLRKQIEATKEPRLREILLQIAYQCVANNAVETGNFNEMIAWKTNYPIEYGKYITQSGLSLAKINTLENIFIAQQKITNGETLSFDEIGNLRKSVQDLARGKSSASSGYSASWVGMMQYVNKLEAGNTDPETFKYYLKIATTGFDINYIQNYVYNRDNAGYNLAS